MTRGIGWVRVLAGPTTLASLSALDDVKVSARRFTLAIDDDLTFRSECRVHVVHDRRWSAFFFSATKTNANTRVLMRFLPSFLFLSLIEGFFVFNSTMSYSPGCRLNRTRSSRFEGGRRALPVVREKQVDNPTVSTKRVLGHRPQGKTSQR